MRESVVWISILIVIGLLGIIAVAFVNMSHTTPMTFTSDKGYNFIDVSNYPPRMQEYYKIFAQKCSRCHTLARPINSKFVGEAWRKYVHRMMRKPGSGLTPKTAEQIIEFLMYDTQVREKG